MKFTLALQTPTILLNVTATDAAGKTEQIQVEFKRYEAEEAYAQMEAYEKLGESVSHIFEGIRLTSEIATLQEANQEVALNAEKLANAQEALEALATKHPTLLENIKGINSIWESKELVQAPEFKNFLKSQIVDFKNIWGTDETTGKKTRVPSLAAAGHLEAYLDIIWKCLPLREALREACVTAIQNTARKA